MISSIAPESISPQFDPRSIEILKKDSISNPSSAEPSWHSATEDHLENPSVNPPAHLPTTSFSLARIASPLSRPFVPRPGSSTPRSRPTSKPPPPQNQNSPPRPPASSPPLSIPAHMADNEDQPTATPAPSAEQQISELRGNMLEMKSSLNDLFSQLRLHFATTNPPQRDPPPHHTPHPTFPTFHAQFSPAPPHPAPQQNSFPNHPPPPQPFPTDNPPNEQGVPPPDTRNPENSPMFGFLGNLAIWNLS
ncbi:hypothetical protein Pst134EB_007937 [Puccinia striiformis f. sp. tritici]|nr:hypothetical protein Pst134EB_007937 [Puccinia striiformis f. sp. tritici]